MTEFSLEYFGYGAGLVVAGWITGMIASFALSVVRNIRG